ncbi:hypothetical protein FH972_002193 [Carpinus fangiana]|uniref:Uncharacterized protein n=1 Tax=Carpinus fangiana TaxID=176857 RepID=A0A5N6QHE6_9ROSI|nr:hypothetical protein FH972_002193 [Carpinus fangiana]
MRDRPSSVDLWDDRCWGLSKPSLGRWSPAGKQKGDLFLVRGGIFPGGLPPNSAKEKAPVWAEDESQEEEDLEEEEEGTDTSGLMVEALGRRSVMEKAPVRFTAPAVFGFSTFMSFRSWIGSTDPLHASWSTSRSGSKWRHTAQKTVLRAQAQSAKVRPIEALPAERQPAQQKPDPPNRPYPNTEPEFNPRFKRSGFTKPGPVQLTARFT